LPSAKTRDGSGPGARMGFVKVEAFMSVVKLAVASRNEVTNNILEICFRKESEESRKIGD